MGSKKELNRGEYLARETLGKALTWANHVKAGEVVDLSDMCAMSPGHGIAPYEAGKLVGKAVCRDVQRGRQVEKEDFSVTPVAATEGANL